jgi:hypothetical protein
MLTLFPDKTITRNNKNLEPVLRYCENCNFSKIISNFLLFSKFKGLRGETGILKDNPALKVKKLSTTVTRWIFCVKFDPQD